MSALVYNPPFSQLPAELVRIIVRHMDVSTVKTLLHSGDERISAIITQTAPSWMFDPICDKIIAQMNYRDKQFVYLAEFDTKISKIRSTMKIDEQELKDMRKAASKSYGSRQFFSDDIDFMHVKIESYDRELCNLHQCKRDIYDYPIAHAESEILKLWEMTTSNAFKKHILQKLNKQIKANTCFQDCTYYEFIKSLEF